MDVKVHSKARRNKDVQRSGVAAGKKSSRGRKLLIGERKHTKGRRIQQRHLSPFPPQHQNYLRSDPGNSPRQLSDHQPQTSQSIFSTLPGDRTTTSEADATPKIAAASRKNMAVAIVYQRGVFDKLRDCAAGRWRRLLPDSEMVSRHLLCRESGTERTKL